MEGVPFCEGHTVSAVCSTGVEGSGHGTVLTGDGGMEGGREGGGRERERERGREGEREGGREGEDVLIVEL